MCVCVFSYDLEEILHITLWQTVESSIITHVSTFNR